MHKRTIVQHELASGAYRLAFLPEENAAVCGCYDGGIRAVDVESGRLRWERQLNGFPFTLSAAPTPSSEEPAIVAGDAGGHAWCFSITGEVLADVDTGYPVYGATLVGNGDRPVLVAGGTGESLKCFNFEGALVAEYPVERHAHRLATADIDGDGEDELVLLDYRNDLVILKWDDGRLGEVYRKTLTVPDEMINWENPRGLLHVMGLDVRDVDGDGRAEIIVGDDFHNRQVVALLDGRGEIRWITDPLSPYADHDRWYELYAATFVRGTEDGRVFSVSGGLIRVYSADGTMLHSAESRTGFSDILPAGRRLLLGSCPNGDTRLTVLSLEEEIEPQIERIPLPAVAAESVARSRVIVSNESSHGSEKGTQDEYWFNLHNLIRPRGNEIGELKDELETAAELTGAHRVRFITSMGFVEDSPPEAPDGAEFNTRRYQIDALHGTRSVSDIVAKAREIEAMGVPTIIRVGHSCMPLITLDTARRILDAAPTAVVGFGSAEDEQPEYVADYVREYLGPLADICREAGGKRLFWKNKNVWWMSMPSRPAVARELFASERAGTFIACTEDSNSRTPELNLMARFGLFLSGGIPDFQVSAHADLYSYNRFHQWEYPKSGHPYLRLLVAQTALGGRFFRASGPFLYRRKGTLSATRFAEESLIPFIKLMERGTVSPPAADSLRWVSPVGLRVHEPSEDWLSDGHNGHASERSTVPSSMKQAVIPNNGCVWGMSPTPEWAIQRSMFAKERQFGLFAPPLPYGAVPFYPAPLDRIAPQTSAVFETDGIDLWRNGPKLRGLEARSALEAELTAGAAGLPFRLSGDPVFCSATGDSPMRIYMVDPGWLDPATREVEISFQGSTDAAELVDLIDDTRIRIRDGRANVTIDRGGFRILEARR
jgi:hypothetical protein